MVRSAQQIDRLLQVLGGAPLPAAALLPGDRQRLGGLCLPCGPAFVRLVADALAVEADAFAALPVRGADLRERQDEADAWRRLRTALLLLAERAGDQAIAAQADALRTAQAILEEVSAERGRAPAAELQSRRRRKRALAEADLLLRSYRQTLAPPRKARPAATAAARHRAAAEIERAFRQHLRRAATSPIAPPGARSRISPTEIAKSCAPAIDQDPCRAETHRAAQQTAQGPVTAAHSKPAPARPAQHISGGNPPMDIRQRFAADVTGEAPPGARPATPLQTDTLRGQKDAVAEQYARCPAPGFDTATRQRLQARGSILWPELLKLCGQGLRDSHDFASRHDFPPDVCDETVAQDAGVAQVIKAAGDLHEAAGAAAAAISRDGRGRAFTVMQAAVGVINDPADPASTQAELAFAEAFRLYEEGTPGGAAALRRERRLQPLREALDRTRSETEELRLLDRYLAETGGKGGDHA